MIKKINVIVGVLSCFLTFCSSCFNPVGFDYNVKQRADLSDLLMFKYGPSIFGIDTSTFTVKAHIRIDDMRIGGVAKLPDGGIVFTSRGKLNSNIGGDEMYITDKYCNLLGTYRCCYAPMGPKVINNKLIVGSSTVESGVDVAYKFQIFGTDNFALRKEYLVREFVDGWLISDWGEKAYFGINPMGVIPREYGYIVELDLTTLDTTVIGEKTDFFYSAEMVVQRHETLLYIFNMLKRDICIYDLQLGVVILTKKVSEYPQIAATEATRIALPYVYKNILYGQFSCNDWDGNEISWLAKFDPVTLELMDFKKLNTIGGYTRGEHQFYAGHYLVMQFERSVIFVDVESGITEHTVTVDESYYY